MVFNKLKSKLLNQSDMYRFYKEEYESSQKKIKKLEKLTTNHQRLLNHLYIFYELEPTPYLAAMRDLSYELLKFMDNVCLKYEFDWWLDFGTLLGTVRHHDFVPWDDDLDCGMMRDDFNKIIPVITKEVEENNLDKVIAAYKQDRGENHTQRWFQIRYHYPGFNNTFTTLDIFPYDYIKNYNGEDIEEKYYDCIREYYTYKEGQDMVPYMKEVSERLNLTLEQDEYLIAGMENVRGEVPKVNMYPYKIIRHDEIFPTKRMQFGKYDFPVPNETIKYVKDIYGENYLRVPRTLRDHKRLNRFNKEEDIMEMLNEGITKLQKANENLE